MSTKRLSVVIDADTSKFDRNIKSMQGTMQEATGGISGALKKAGGAFTGLVGGIGKIAGAVGVFKLVDAGINMISNSVSSAINRFDTLQNAERVFQNMGFEAGETKVMMDSLVDSITGLPTPMESAVQGVQRLASSTGDLKGSEKIYSALNNSVLGFGGSNEEVDRTVQMLSRSLQKGKVQGDEWNTMMDTMGPVMNAVAEEMGYTTDQLREGLSNGSIDINEFTDTLLRMNEEGGGGLASLEQIAKDATAGIGTALENVQNAFNRGMTSIIESINEALEDKGLPNISEMIQIFGQKAEAVFNRVAESIPPMIDWFSNLFSTISNSTAFQSLKEVVGTALDGIRDFSGSEAWENIKTALKDIGEAILEIDFGEIISQAGEFLDKWGPLIAGIAGAIAVFEALSVIVPIVVGAFKGFMILKTLISSVGLLQTGITLLAPVIGGLSLPILAVSIAIGALIAIGVALWKNWDEIKAKASELWEGISTAFSNIVTSIGEALGGAWEATKIWASNMWNTAIETGGQFLEGLGMFFIQLPEKFTYWLGLAIGTVIGWVAKLVLKGYEAGSQFVSSVISFIQELPSRVGTWLSNTISRVTTWVSNMITNAIQAGTQFLTNVINFFRQLPGQIQTWLSQAISKVVTWGINLGNKGREAGRKLFNAVVNAVKGLPNQLVSIGKDLVRGFWNGIKSMRSWLTSKVTGFFSGIVDGVKGVFKIKSPSRVFKSIGGFVIEGFMVGIDSLSSKATKQMEGFSKGVIGITDSVRSDIESDMNPNINMKGHKGFASLLLNARDVQPEVHLHVSEGDIYLDETKVGRRVAPIVKQENEKQDRRNKRSHGKEWRTA